MGSYATYLLETLVTLFAVCGLACVVLFSARRMGLRGTSGPLQLVGQLPLDAKRAVYLIRVGRAGGKVLIVGASEAGLTRLGHVSSENLLLAEASPENDRTTSNVSFKQALARALGTSKKQGS